MLSFLRRARIALGVLLIAGTTAAGAQASGGSVAIVMDRQGDVEVSTAGQSVRVNLLDYLPAEAQLKLAKGGTATVVYLATSQEWAFTGPGRYRLAGAQPVAMEGAAPAARAVPKSSSSVLQRMEPAQRERMTLGAVVMRTVGPLRVRSPDSVDVLQPRVTLLWHNPSRQAVRVVVQSAVSSAVVAQAELDGERWTTPQALPPGDYLWRVESLTDAATRTRAGRFRVVDPGDERNALYRDRPISFADRLARAMQLEADELPHDAQLLWLELASERPQEETLKAWLR